MSVKRETFLFIVLMACFFSEASFSLESIDDFQLRDQSLPFSNRDKNGNFRMQVTFERNDLFEAKTVPVIIPDEISSKRIDSSVKIEFRVDGLGTVIDPKIVRSSQEGVYDKYALESLQQWTIIPKDDQDSYYPTYTQEFTFECNCICR